jgi:hypothetical protein
MSSEIEQLRRLFKEELDKLDEYRPNAFMLSRMEEQDQDGDGDEDFDDVRVARYTKGGMSREKALAKVKRKPMGKPAKKSEGTNLSESMSRMTLLERRALHESVKQMLFNESDSEGSSPWAGKISTASTDPINPAWAPSQQATQGGSTSIPVELPTQVSPVGSTISSGGKVIYEKTSGGWMTTVRATPNQVLGFAVEGARIRLKSEIDRASNGDQISVPKQVLRNPNLANTGNDLTLVKDGDSFYDPTPLRDDVLQRVADQVRSGAVTYTAAQGADDISKASDSDAFDLGDVFFEFNRDNPNEVTISIPGEGPALNRALEQLFGRSKNIAALWMEAERESVSGKPILKVGWNLADEGYFLKKLFPYKVGKFKFAPVDNKYVATIDIMPGRLPGLKRDLSRLTGKK